MIIVTIFASIVGFLLGVLFLLFIFTIFVRIALAPFKIIAGQLEEIGVLSAEIKDRLAHRAWKKSRPRAAVKFLNQEKGRLPDWVPNLNYYFPEWKQVKSLVDEFDAKFVSVEESVEKPEKQPEPAMSSKERWALKRDSIVCSVKEWADKKKEARKAR